MPPKKVKKFCRVTKFLEQNDKDLYQALDDLCLLGLFRPRRDKGITFLYPSDKAYRKKIIDHSYSNSPEKAVEMFKCLILFDYYKNPSDFSRGSISNAHNEIVEIETTTAKDVKLKSGHTLTPNKEYIPLRDGEPVTVYTLTGKGELTKSGIKASMKPQDSKYKARGGAEQRVQGLAEFVHKEYCNVNRSIYKAVVSCIYGYASTLENSANSKKIYDRICASARASFYSIFEPYNSVRNSEVDTIISESGIYNMIEKLSEDNKITFMKKGVDSYDAHLKDLIIIHGSSSDAKEIDNRDIILCNTKTLTEARINVLNAYKGNDFRLYRDVLSVYCYLAAVMESEDDTYFNNCFVYSIKNIFNEPTCFKEGTNDAVTNASLYLNLMKSDAFLYKQVYERSQINANYDDLDGALPDPNDSKCFTIQFSDVVSKHGGGAETFFGGMCK
jgi:hypothetical protein